MAVSQARNIIALPHTYLFSQDYRMRVKPQFYTQEHIQSTNTKCKPSPHLFLQAYFETFVLGPILYSWYIIPVQIFTDEDRQRRSQTPTWRYPFCLSSVWLISSSLVYCPFGQGWKTAKNRSRPRLRSVFLGNSNLRLWLMLLIEFLPPSC